MGWTQGLASDGCRTANTQLLLGWQCPGSLALTNERQDAGCECPCREARVGQGTETPSAGSQRGTEARMPMTT